LEQCRNKQVQLWSLELGVVKCMRRPVGGAAYSCHLSRPSDPTKFQMSYRATTAKINTKSSVGASHRCQLSGRCLRAEVCNAASWCYTSTTLRSWLIALPHLPRSRREGLGKWTHEGVTEILHGSDSARPARGGGGGCTYELAGGTGRGRRKEKDEPVN